MLDQSHPSSADLSQVRQVAIEAAVAAGEVLRDRYGKVEQLRLKGEVDLVTEVDERSEAIVVGIIGRHFPDHRVLAEEGTVGGSDPRFRWLVDPLDGTTNYAHGLPFFCTSIAFEQEGRVVIGLTYDPLRDELFLAQRGRGATLNGRRLTVSPTEVLINSMLATGFPYDRTHLARALSQFGTFSRTSRAVRRLGSAALDAAYVAAGRLECYWEAIVKPWDVAAGWLLVEEAGGLVTDLTGGPFSLESGEILATNGPLHPLMLAGLAEAEQPPA
jgi:myo-inositol-1(or 4)-monophosphatase